LCCNKESFIIMNKWTNHVWGQISPLFEQIVKHPFVSGLVDGSLGREKFDFYLHQDALYLNDFGRALAFIASKCQNDGHREAFLAFAKDTMEVEGALHSSFLGDFQSRPVVQQSPTCLLYTSYIWRQLSQYPLEVAVASVLPCFWIYKEVGDYILKQTISPNNPYKDWINTYGGEEYGEAVKRAIDIADEMAAQSSPATVTEMTHVFITCSKMEWMFWESAFTQEVWPV
ncbi:MAG: thiaminase II, partial [Candidatus Adiutrix sp.]